VLQCVVVGYGGLLCVVVGCRVLKCADDEEYVKASSPLNRAVEVQCVALCCSALQCVAVCCSVLQCVIMFCCGLSWVEVY